MRLRFQKYGIFYFLGGIFAVWLKYEYSRAGSDELLWILTPVTWWAGCLCSTSFEYVPGMGYVNHTIRFIIAPSCSGVQFLLIAMLMLLFAFIHRMKNQKEGGVWFLCSLAGAYGYTVLVNGIRIAVSIRFPVMLERAGFHMGRQFPERLHTMIGAAVYFTALLLLYQGADAVLRTWEKHGKAEASYDFLGRRRTYLVPTFWYLFIVLGIPFLNRAVGKNSRAYLEYALVTSGVCAGVLTAAKLGKRLLSVYRRRCVSRKQTRLLRE